MDTRRTHRTAHILVRVVGVIAFIGATTACRAGRDPELAAMVDDPDAALEFLYPDGVVEPGTSPTAIEYIRDRNWSNDGFDTLAQVLESAATAHRDADDPKSELSALAATDTINLLGARGENKIGSKAYDSLGYILANYIIDIDNAIEEYPPALDELGNVFDGLPPSAEFDREPLEVVLRQVLTNTEAVQVVMDAANQFGSNRLAGAIELGGEPGLVTFVVQTNCKLAGNLIRSAGFDDDNDLGGARAAAMREVIGDAIYAQPVAGAKFADYLKGNVIKRGADVWDGPNASDRPLSLLGAKGGAILWDAESVMEKSVGVQLGEAGLLPDRFPQTGELFPWIVDGKFDAELALSPAHVAEFRVQFGASDYQSMVFSIRRWF